MTGTGSKRALNGWHHPAACDNGGKETAMERHNLFVPDKLAYARGERPQVPCILCAAGILFAAGRCSQPP